MPNGQGRKVSGTKSNGNGNGNGQGGKATDTVAGLEVPRLFTTPGMHPYDEIDWERRDSQIVSYTGKVSFEQNGVEFPSDWSLNATNIVTEKYFRGKLNTPSREWSVKQIIDRVVDSIVAWGVDQGRFATDEDRDTFDAELKHILVTQKASFNSPVWFNIGVPTRAQQASACFILHVEDRMDSIADWYRDEMFIFKGGSGSGLNVSNLRSSYEQLGIGGYSSGPVSFMRGADAAAGTIKSGGATRRAAKMVVFNIDHPDIIQLRDGSPGFIWCKAKEETKARALKAAGFDMSVDSGVDAYSIQYQNANNSIRVTDEFMSAYLEGRDWHTRAVTTGDVINTYEARDVMKQISQAAWECADPGMQYHSTVNDWHTAPAAGPITASNPCSEYMHIDNSPCNLASINLLKFLREDGTFDTNSFEHTVFTVLLGQAILCVAADYPTEQIGKNARGFRQLGIGYANLGALLMALGVAYDSDQGRSWAAAITSLMQGASYRASAHFAEIVGPYPGTDDLPGFAHPENRQATLRVLDKHAAFSKVIAQRPGADDRKLDKRVDLYYTEVVGAGRPLVTDSELARVIGRANQVWEETLELAERFGVENSQVSVLAPTGCLEGGSLVATERGLVRLGSLGDPSGEKWQPLEVDVMTDDGPRRTTQFFVNGVAPVVDVKTSRGYSIKGTPEHRVKVVTDTGRWEWKRFADLTLGDVVPLAMDQLVGDPQVVPLPPLPEAYWTSDHTTVVPREMNSDLAEFLGYFMGDGSLHARGIRLCVAQEDMDVVDHLARLGKSLFGLEAHVSEQKGYTEVAFHSVRLVLWWEACGFAKHLPSEDHSGKGYHPHIPSAVLYSNDKNIYGAFVSGLFEADGTVTQGVPNWGTTCLPLSYDVQTLLLALGFPTTRKFDTTGWGRSTSATLRLVNSSYNPRWQEEVGFISGRKNAKVNISELQQAARTDKIPMTRETIDRLAPANDRLRRVLLLEQGRTGRVSRRAALELLSRTDDLELAKAVRFFYDAVATTALVEEELTFDLSVPDNVTYVANGFVSHNTIGFMMDCDTTGVEPDLALKKVKKMVGGGTMSIVNQTLPRALRRLGYNDEQNEAIVAYVEENNTVIDAPALKPEHYDVFACSFTTDNLIGHMGHVKMMAAVQPFISGAISKCVTGGTLVTSADGLIRIGSLHDGEAADSFRPSVYGVASLGGVQKTDAFYYGGVRPVMSMSLRSGQRVEGTPNHRVLVARDGGLDWRRLDEIQRGEYVATQYGADLWSALPPLFFDFEPSPRRCSQKTVSVPREMSEELAFLLGAYVSEGHTTRSNWTITITNSVDEVLEKVASAWSSVFGVDARIVRQDGKCPGVVVSSKTIVEFLEYLGCGARASSKRIPDAILRSPRPMVLAFLQGLFLDAYATGSGMAKIAICVDSPALLDDLQAVLTNLGVVHGRITKFNPTNSKDYDEVYACGEHAKRLGKLVPFLEPEKAARAEWILSSEFSQSTADIVPGLSPRDLFAMLPKGTSGRNGRAGRSSFSFLTDPRTRQVSRRTLERVAQHPGVRLPSWLRTILDDGLHFSPVEELFVLGEREVYDLSVPGTHAFVGNGIVNHNTVNVPEQAGVEDMEEIFVEGWRLGLKAVAMYRDNCKADQPLSAEIKKTVDETVGETPALAARRRMPRVRQSMTYSFRVADTEGYVHVGLYPDTGQPGELFIKVAKQGSTLAGVMGAFALSVSMGLQHGVPLETFVEKFVNDTFEPHGITDDPDIRFAKSLMDYIFRRLALDFLPEDKRLALGIRSVQERQEMLDGPPANGGNGVNIIKTDEPKPEVKELGSTADLVPALDAPLCSNCGTRMRPAGSCFACESCGSTSGCS